MNILGICDLPDALKVIRIVMIVITIIKISVPILLILSLLIKFTRAVVSSDSDMLSKAKKSAASSVIVAILVFFIPTFVDVIVKFVSPKGDYSTCISDISIETINTAHYKIEDDFVSKAEETLDVNNYYSALNYLINITDENKKNYYLNRINKSKEKKAEELVKIAEESLNINDYNVARYFCESLTNSDIKTKLDIRIKEVKTKIDSSYSITPEPEKGDGGSQDSGSRGVVITHPELTENPITNYINVDDMNRIIANVVKSKGYYTRGAVVGVATTVINTLSNKNYSIPYLLGGRYSIPGEWGINPKWGTKIIKDNEEKISGLDCRNFVIWTFKQAGLSLNRGYGEEGSVEKSFDRRYQNISDARPGDVIDAMKHIMLVVSKDDKGYTVAESSGKVKLKYYTFDFLKNDGYYAYNMDAIYNNTALSCSLNNSYRPYSGACRIPKSEFPSYY